ncbi:E3 ubiquitin-protein ligase RNF152-like [Xiphophorus maculatus]|uniref:E3 ubiquitin-protein ligase RNF152-like n=1 Tax=Xiphophorus maculatus TaxID=8083 RepID=A0A3B5QG59_XIPMA|nr:E3 ubiquitin-protein ligase RNF152-like [Xiphophorus maculatus]XP_023199087.1 E3 ubiquitin-protein ligase RNF152-like [Xiphophorus maculatus]XP_023199088.1 E3 ubiquitin-protein ligase RNF152-like [Xiphophorus maculatus]
MNPYGDDVSGFSGGPVPYSASNPSYSVDPLVPPFVQTGRSTLPPPVAHLPPALIGPALPGPAPSSILPLPAFSPTGNPYAPTGLQPPQLSVPDLQPPRDESGPDLECAICFSEFNNVFRCPKMLNCKHTFCLECLARMNVKSLEPGAIQCPLCRGLTPLPPLGLPKLATDSDVLSYLPAAMQRVYSIRFIRNKGKLQVKRSSDGPGRLGRPGRRSVTSLRSVNRTLDVGRPSPTSRDSRGEAGGLGGALFRLTGRPVCRAFLLTAVVMMMVLLTGIIIYLISK